MENENEWATIPTELIDLSPFLARRHFNKKAMEELAKSIEERGLLHPVTVRRVAERYQLLAGARRYKAITEYLKWKRIDVKIIIANDQEARRVVAIENWLHDALSAYESLELIVAMVDDELVKEGVYLSGEENPLERVDKLLSKLHSIDVHKDYVATKSNHSKLSKEFLGKIAHKLDQFFENLPKPLKRETFFRHYLPLLLGSDEQIRKDAIEQKLNKHQIRALIALRKVSADLYDQAIKNPKKLFKQDSKTSLPKKISDCSGREIEKLANSHRSAVKDKPESSTPKQCKREFLILKMHRLGIPQERIAGQIGINRKTVANYIQQEEALLKPIRKALRKLRTPEVVAEEFSAPLALVWSLRLEGLTDQERFEALGWNLSTWNNLTWPNLDERFGDNWPGRIPARLVAHTLFFITRQGDLVMDPMAGGGVVPDVCLLFNRRCWSFDLKTGHQWRPEIETHHWDPDQMTWPVHSKEKPAVIFFDPPYFDKKEKEYGPESISALTLEEYLDFFRKFFKLAHSHVRPGGLIAFLNSDWRDFRNTALLDEDFSKSLTMADYVVLLREAGWQGPVHVECPLSHERFEPIEVAQMQKTRSLGVINRFLLIGKRLG